MIRLVALLWASLLLGGCGAPSILLTPVSNTGGLEEVVAEDGEGLFASKILILPVEGMIINARTPGLLEQGENQVSLINEQLDRAAKDGKVKAVVLRINSPGGTVTASDTIYQLLAEFRKKTGKPIVASCQEVAASGGYYVASASDRIVAQPTSVVGSIGVIFTTFDVEGTLDKVGARTYTMKSGPLKDMGSPFKEMTPEERRVLQEIVDEYFGRFRTLVTTRRGLTTEQAIAVTDGRVFTGEQAYQRKLVDQLGTLHDAVALARDLAKAKGASAILYTRPFGYSGSIYASTSLPKQDGKVMTLALPGSKSILPTGFYYLWQP